MRKTPFLIFAMLLLASCNQKNGTNTQINDAADDRDVLEQTHTIDKKADHDGITWVGIKTTPSQETALANYELWPIGKDNDKLLVENFPLFACNNVRWNLNEKGGIDLRYTRTPCVEFAINTHVVYDAQGMEKLRLKQDSSKAYLFTFQKKNNAEHEISLLTDGMCEGEIPYSSEKHTPQSVIERCEN